MPDEPKYTLEEAEKLIGRRKCRMYGHAIQQHGGTFTPPIWHCANCDVVVTFTYPEDVK